MKKLFLIPLLALCSCVMAWGATVEVGTFAELKSAINSASDGDVVKLTGNITGSTSNSSANVLNITKSITIDGQGNTLKNCGNYSVFRVNQGVASPQFVTITIKDLKMIQPEGDDYGIASNSSLGQLTLENCDISCAAGGNPHGIIIGGPAPEGGSKLIIKNTHINATASGYPIRVFSPMDITMEDSQTEGYCGVYFASAANGYAGSEGPRGSILDAKRCNFDAPNVHSGASNAFAVFALEDGDMTFNLNNCGMNGEKLGDQGQALFCLSEWTLDENRGVGAINITLSGDNSYFNVSSDVLENNYIWKNPSGDPDYGPKSEHYYKEMAAEDAINVTVNFTITGGTYSVNPANLIFKNNFYMTKEGDEWVKHYDAVPFTIPDEYEVKEITTQQGGLQTTLYRVRKKITTSYSINQDVEGQGAGQNEHTEFLINGNETVAAASTVANYVEVSNNATLTLPAGKKLEVTNGLDVTGGATLDVAAGSTLVVGEGGVTSQNTGSIVIEANENGSASFLLDPEVIVNTTPNLTVKMTVKGKGYKNEPSGKTYYWHRFAAPVVMAEAWSKAPELPTWLYGWDYTAEGGQGAWAELPTSMAMVPFQGYTLSPEHLVASEDEEIVYSFKGQLAGNQNMNLQFNARGFNFFGNSYTGYIDVLTLVDQLMGNENIDGSVYMWNNGEQGYEPVSLQDLKENPNHYPAWMREIAPMQTFILRQINTGEDVSTLLNYENSIWNNPRYGNVPAPTPAPKRAAADADPFVRVMITAANGQNSQMSFAENADRSDDFEKGYDALKYMNENSINVYSTLDGQNLSNVATNDLEGKTLTLQTNDEIAYTMSFPIVEGEEYAIRDNATGVIIAIEEGATYEFAAQPNSIVEGRFEIVSVAKVPTAIENAEVKANVKGIYTLTGQYVGEDFEAVPAGVYVVNGVKIVK